MTPSLENHVAIVTGGGRGIGRAIALRLAGDGARVVVTGPEAGELESTAALIRESRGDALAIIADVRIENQIQSMLKRTLEECGRVDVLVNNAGIIGPTAPVQDVRQPDWDDVLAVNLTGAFLCAKAVLPAMIAQRSGRIINISSIAGKIAYALRSPYAASKWGLIGLTLALAKEAGPHNIQVNAICPGPVAGERMQGVMKRRAEELGLPVSEVEREYTETTLLNRFVQPDDIAAMAAYLASAAAANITGQTFDVTAGYGL